MRLAVPLFALMLAACAAPPGPATAPPWAPPPLERAISVRNGRTGSPLSFSRLLGELAAADVVFLGESHTDETTHRVEAAVYAGLLRRRAGRVVLALEMFERDVQPDLDAYLAGAIGEAAFLERARPWGNYATAYRPLVERARAEGKPVVASNFPQPLRMKVARGGLAALEALSSDPTGLPGEWLPNTPAYWRRADNAVRSHREMMRGQRAGDPQRLTSTQTLWDNSMGGACAAALEEHPGHLVLHVNGGFHSAYWDGTVRQLRLRKPAARVRTVAIVPVEDPALAELQGTPLADFVVFAAARATEETDDYWSVRTSRELRYRLHLPRGAAAEHPVPLLIWLSGGGLGAADGLDLWKERLGPEAAVAVLEAPYRETQPDLSAGGRWYWPDTFTEDLDALRDGLERTWAYLLRHQPVDPARVCVAGEGSGATVVAAAALLTGRMQIKAVALHPRHFTKLKDFPLPLPELQGETPLPRRSLRVVAGSAGEEWWQSELGEYASVGLPSELLPAARDPWEAVVQEENVVRAALGLPPRAAGTEAGRAFVVAGGDAPRARYWARLLAARYARVTGAPVAVLATPAEADGRRLPAEVQPAAFQDGEALPLCPGPFGGTTVLVVLPGTPVAERDAWLSLAEDDPVRARSRFHSLKLAEPGAENSLHAVLADVLAGGRHNVLIVPAVFHAGAETMRGLAAEVADLDQQMTLRWLPGLGGALRPAAE